MAEKKPAGEGKHRELPQLIFEAAPGGWQEVPPPQESDVAQALTNDIRRTIMQLLDRSAMREYKLVELVNRMLGKRYRESLIRYHLRKLRQANLVGLMPGKRPRSIIVYRKANIRLQVQARPEPIAEEIIEEFVPETPKEVAEELKKVFKK
jgi:DNA-binding transcriptional ArsR family regulator